VVDSFSGRWLVHEPLVVYFECLVKEKQGLDGVK
jgi:hypothetical protein